jgi:Glycosyltransferase family 87
MKRRNLQPFLFAFFSFLLIFHFMLFWHGASMALRGFADFSTFYSAARIVQSGMGNQLYSTTVQAHVQSMLYPNAVTRNGLLPYIHPPFEVLLYLPLAFFPYPVAFFIWGTVNMLLLLLTVRLLWPYMAELKAVWTPLPVLVFLGFFPVFEDLLQGQDSILLLLVFTLVFISLKKGRDFLGGIFLAIGLFKFQFTLPFLVPFILWRRWKFLGGFAVSSAALFLLSLPVTGFRGTLSYATFLSTLVKGLSSHHVQNVLGITSKAMPNIRGAIEMMAPALFPQSFQKPLIVLVSGLAVLWLSRQWPLGHTHSEKTFDLGFSLAAVTSVLVGYHLEMHDLSLLLIPFILTLNWILKGEICPGRRRLLMYGIIFLFFVSPVYLFLIVRDKVFLLFLPILAFLILLSWELVFPAGGSAGPVSEDVPHPVASAS